MKLQLSNATVQYRNPDQTDSGGEEYQVTAFDERFGDELVIAIFGFDNAHEEGFYKARAKQMANKLAEEINAQ